MDLFRVLKYYHLNRTHLNQVLCVLIFRPSKHNSLFISEFSELLSGIVPLFDDILVIGDFNIHVYCGTNSQAKELLKLIDSFHFQQYVNESTHHHGHMLDLILGTGTFVNNVMVTDNYFSDHKHSYV